MTEHEDLVAEITQVEKMSTADRLKHAKKRRQQQLKKFSQYEKQLEKEHNKKNKNRNNATKRQKKVATSRHVEFVSNIMLLEAAARNDLSEVRALLKRGVSPDVTNEDGLTALHQCCIDDLEEMLRVLLEFGANVNAKDSELWTPLHAAATCGHIHLCRVLIDNRAELLSVNADGNMPYDICEDDVTLDFIEGEMAKRSVTQEEIDQTRLSAENTMLTDLQNQANNGEDLEFRGRVGETPLHIAAANGYVSVTEFLLKQRVSVDVEDEDSWQPIHAAACWGHLPVLELLVLHGADLEAKTRNGETPFDICEDLEMKERMIELKNEIETKGVVKNRNLVRRRSTNTRSSVVSNSSTSLYNSNSSLVEKGHQRLGSKSDLAHHASTEPPAEEARRMQRLDRRHSVRRTSMREKSAISWKEAVEEGRRIRGSISSNDGEEDEDLEEPRSVEDVKMKFENLPANRRKEMEAGGQESKADSRKPGSSMGESENIWAQAAGTLPHQPKSDSSPAPQKLKATAPVPPTVSSSTENRNGKAVDTQPSSKNPQSTAKSTDKPQTQKATNVPVSVPAVKKQPPPSSRDPNKPPPPKAVVRPTPQQKPQHEVASAGKSQPGQSAPLKQASHDTHDTRNNAPHKPSEDSAIESAHANNRQSSVPSGTLSDLKKHRAQALQEKLTNSLRFKDGESIHEQVSEYNNSLAGDSAATESKADQITPTKPSNGETQKTNYMPRGERSSATKYKFTATTVVGEPDAQTSCCVLQ